MKNMLTIISTLSALLLMVGVAEAGHHEGGGDAKSCSSKSGHTAGPYFISPKDGDTVSAKLTVKMGINGLKVHKAGKQIEGTGHHHLIIDGAYVPESKVVAKDAKHLHFGKGQTETAINLSKGEHTLTLQFADGFHQSYGKVFSRTIRVIVE